MKNLFVLDSDTDNIIEYVDGNLDEKLKSISSGNYLNKLKKRRSFICGIKGKFLTNKEIVFLKKYKPWGIILFQEI